MAMLAIAQIPEVLICQSQNNVGIRLLISHTKDMYQVSEPMVPLVLSRTTIIMTNRSKFKIIMYQKLKRFFNCVHKHINCIGSIQRM